MGKQGVTSDLTHNYLLVFAYPTLLKRNKARAIPNVALQQQLAKVKVSAGKSWEAKHDEERQTLSAQQK